MRQREEALKQREETFRKKLTEELDTQVRSARREIDDVIDGLKEKATTIAREAAARHVVSTGAAGAARSDARAAVDAVMQRALEPAGAPSAAPEPAVAGQRATVGDRVIFGALGLEAVVTAIHDEFRRSRRARQTHAREPERSAGRGRRRPRQRSASTWISSRARRRPWT